MARLRAATGSGIAIRFMPQVGCILSSRCSVVVTVSSRVLAQQTLLRPPANAPSQCRRRAMPATDRWQWPMATLVFQTRLRASLALLALCAVHLCRVGPGKL